MGPSLCRPVLAQTCPCDSSLGARGAAPIPTAEVLHLYPQQRCCTYTHGTIYADDLLIHSHIPMPHIHVSALHNGCMACMAADLMNGSMACMAADLMNGSMGQCLVPWRCVGIATYVPWRCVGIATYVATLAHWYYRRKVAPSPSPLALAPRPTKPPTSLYHQRSTGSPSPSPLALAASR